MKRDGIIRFVLAGFWILLLGVLCAVPVCSTNPRSFDNKKDMELSEGGETATVIFSHGLGDTPNGWFPVAKMMKPLHGNVRWILPCAPNNPVTVNGGMRMTSWMDILEIPISIKSPDNGKDIDASVEIIHKIIDAEIERGTPANRIVVGGFSQGAALAPVAALRYTKAKLGGIIMFSGWALPKQNLAELAEASKSNGIPVLIGHGDSDQVVLYENAGNVAEIFHGAGFSDVTVKTYKGLGHGSCPSETDDLSAWIGRVLA
jgi:predicted esterase